MESGVTRLRDTDINISELLTVRGLHLDENMSVALVCLDGKNQTVRHKKSDSIYIVISGCGNFNINGESFTVSTGDTIHIKAGDQYSDSGKLTMICINRPPFSQEDLEIIEEA